MVSMKGSKGKGKHKISHMRIEPGANGFMAETHFEPNHSENGPSAYKEPLKHMFSGKTAGAQLAKHVKQSFAPDEQGAVADAAQGGQAMPAMGNSMNDAPGM